MAAAMLCILTNMAIGQHTVSVKVLDAETNEPLIGASVFLSSTKGAITNAEGIGTITNIQEGNITVRISFVGYETQRLTLQLPMTGTSPLIVMLEPHEDEMEEILVTATRSSRSIEDIPTRIEFLGAEELQEKAVMRSANIAMLLRESTGIQMQITSPSSANQSIRIQGLDGRYTQLLKDGFPLYGGFSGGLSIMQIPPLDLRQVEVIKGSSSTLYGGGAIAGIVNLVSIQPEENPLTKVMLDFTSAGGTTLNAFHTQRKGKWGFSLFGSGHLQKAFDANGDNFSDLPDIESLTINPVIFYYPSNESQFRLALNGTFEKRLGGNTTAIENEQASNSQYLLTNNTNRFSYQASYSQTFSNQAQLTIKNSLLHFDRGISEFQYVFDGEQIATFSEATYAINNGSNSWLFGANLYTDRFKEGNTISADRSYSQFTLGGFIQNNSKLSETLSLESGFRFDNAKDYGSFALPRLSFLYKASNKLSYRLGGGLGYKLPTVFTEDTERQAFRGVLSLNLTDLKPERSYGANFDINYRTSLGGEWTFSLNQLFYQTQLTDPVVLRPQGVDSFVFQNADGPIRTRGMETNMKLTYKDFKLFVNYAYADTDLQYDNINEQKPLTPQHSAGIVLVYEEHEKWRIGLESYYTGRQFRSDYTVTNDYWLVGIMALRKFNRLSVYANFENFTDTRQSRFENIDLSNSLQPGALDVWAPLEGFIVNGGIIVEF